MVHTNNNLKGKPKKKVKEEKDIAVYPFSVDIASSPERKYLIGVYQIAKLSYLSLLLSVIFCVFLIIRALSITSKPTFIYWNDLENKFAFYPTKFSAAPKENVEVINANKYIDEYFVKTYIEKRFSISPDLTQNYKTWCDCNSNNMSINANNKTISKLGVLNTNEPCYLCKFSASNIYNALAINDKVAFERLAQEHIFKQVKILDIKTVVSAPVGRELTMIDKFLDKKQVLSIVTEYRVDFIVETISHNKVIERDVFIAYLTTTGPETIPQRRTVSKASYLFNPNYSLVLSNYLSNNSKGDSND